VIANRFKSSSPDCELFLHQPLQFLLNADDDVARAFVDGLDTSTKVTTTVVNHDETLGGWHLYAMATSSDGSPRSIHILLWKIAPLQETVGAVAAAANAAHQ
jgi:hypothetical protein